MADAFFGARAVNEVVDIVAVNIVRQSAAGGKSKAFTTENTESTEFLELNLSVRSVRSVTSVVSMIATAHERMFPGLRQQLARDLRVQIDRVQQLLLLDVLALGVRDVNRAGTDQ